MEEDHIGMEGISSDDHVGVVLPKCFNRPTRSGEYYAFASGRTYNVCQECFDLLP